MLRTILFAKRPWPASQDGGRTDSNLRPHTPSVMRYQAALRPDQLTLGCPSDITLSGDAHLVRRFGHGKSGEMNEASARQEMERAKEDCVGLGGDPCRLPASRAAWRAGVGQSQLGLAGPGHYHLHRRQWHSCRSGPASAGREPQLGAVGTDRRYGLPTAGVALDLVRRRRTTCLSRHANLVRLNPSYRLGWDCGGEQ